MAQYLSRFLFDLPELHCGGGKALLVADAILLLVASTGARLPIFVVVQRAAAATYSRRGS